MIRRISLPVQIIAVLLLVFSLGHYATQGIVRFFYTFSLVFKEILGAFLPFIVFFFITAGILSFKKNAAKVIGILITSIIASNLIVSITSFFIGKSLLSFITKGINNNGLVVPDSVDPYFRLSIPSFIASEQAMLTALILGIVLTFISLPKVEVVINRGKSIVEFILNKIFIPFIPIYIIGFLLKVKYEGIFGALFQSYGKAFGAIVALHFLYIATYYFLASGFRMSKAIKYMKVSSASYLTAFSTMSSTAAIPVTVNCAEKNTEGRRLPSIAAPIMANVHLLGDSITTPVFALVTMYLFLGYIPDFFTYLVFVFYFCITMLATSGVPGGGIIVMIPILKSVLGFTPEMVSIITTLYLLQDSFGTAANVSGDGALMIIINRWLKRFRII